MPNFTDPEKKALADLHRFLIEKGLKNTASTLKKEVPLSTSRSTGPETAKDWHGLWNRLLPKDDDHSSSSESSESSSEETSNDSSSESSSSEVNRESALLTAERGRGQSPSKIEITEAKAVITGIVCIIEFIVFIVLVKLIVFISKLIVFIFKLIVFIFFLLI